MKNYSEMSDFEINCEIARVMGYTAKGFIHDLHSGAWNPCVNPYDAWPVIVENKISIVSVKNGWLAVPYNSVIDGWTSDDSDSMYADDAIHHNNPLRAAMIVFLMMQDAKNG